MVKQIAYLGPAGTYTEAAALQYDPQAKLLPFPSIAAVVAAVDSRMTEEGVVPIENSLEGSVTDTLDLLIHDSNLSILNEMVIPIEHCLLVKPGGSAQEIKLVYSHPQALAQCRRFIERHFPAAQAVAALSTAAAVEDMLGSQSPAAAIATSRAAEIYGAEILSRGIQDSLANHTRFVVLAQHDHAPTGRDKTSLCFSFNDDRSGMLYSAMGHFATRNINLAKVESRPNKESLGRYIFLIDLDGHREDASVQEALSSLEAEVSMMKVFGSYPRYQNS
ncbi:MAG: prephenate dehydratase [Chloroflexi bacterium]|nr:prephenate dehydratase [Chloroflexota bacterium]